MPLRRRGQVRLPRNIERVPVSWQLLIEFCGRFYIDRPDLARSTRSAQTPPVTAACAKGAASRLASSVFVTVLAEVTNLEPKRLPRAPYSVANKQPNETLDMTGSSL